MKPTVRRCDHGLSLVELLMALAISAVLLLPLAALLQDAMESGAVGRSALDLNGDLRFALDRVAARVTTAARPAQLQPQAPPPQFPPYGDTPAVAAWIAPFAYSVSGTSLVETDPGVTPTRTSVIAANVASFKLSAVDTTYGQGLVRIELTLAANGASASGARTVRLWGPQ
ncbi:prepilin-type N-terminal cleavage/methylation domain-containing protein [Massilia sp. 9096]|uniref:prepilin-type N-terminal cleavage/methylation domain-containing protein n=1 Tax=Massilia sp. 9096 TaxID=1500894 RepID=UPI00056ADBF5|nr:prepilin-type N-terminal cleavage/methylation domain-containing protein [Massilia sp. 9096]